MNTALRLLLIGLAALLAAMPASAMTRKEKDKPREFTVVIDPGHGGADHGAIGKRTNEKSINLAVANKLARLIRDNMSDVRVVCTRSDDRFVTLQGRADIANRENGDLFISIHTNSIDKKARNRLTVAGASVYTLGFRRSKENLEVAMRENAVMKMEDDYSTVYEGFDPSSTESYIIFEMSQNKHMDESLAAASAIQQELVMTAGRRDRGVRQANFWVLFKTGMPAILVELDFICNPTQEEFMRSEKGQDKLARAIYNGFKAYKQHSDVQHRALAGDTPAPAAPAAPAGPAVPADPAVRKDSDDRRSVDESDDNKGAESSVAASEIDSPADAIIYKVQFLTSSKPLRAGAPELRGIRDFESYRDGGAYKYTTGAFTSQEDAAGLLRRVKKKFNDAFIIKTQGGKRIK